MSESAARPILKKYQAAVPVGNGRCVWPRGRARRFGWSSARGQILDSGMGDHRRPFKHRLGRSTAPANCCQPHSPSRRCGRGEAKQRRSWSPMTSWRTTGMTCALSLWKHAGSVWRGCYGPRTRGWRRHPAQRGVVSALMGGSRRTTFERLQQAVPSAVSLTEDMRGHRSSEFQKVSFRKFTDNVRCVSLAPSQFATALGTSRRTFLSP